MNYADVIMQFFYEMAPVVSVPQAVQFEAVSSAVFGTKQRRFGPMPSPETQVAVRDVLRTTETALFYLPWGCSKLHEGVGLDLLEFTALKQLRCLSEELLRFGKQSTFVFRVEDLADRWLFGDARLPAIEQYATQFQQLVRVMLPNAKVELESYFTTYAAFSGHAAAYAPVFYRYLTGAGDSAGLRELGWLGDVSEEQRAHYREMYSLFYPGKDPNRLLANYFAGVLARVALKATAQPTTPHIQLAFAPPVPGDPTKRVQLHYRTMPERYTHTHRAPWNARGYVQIGEDNRCTPKIMGFNEQLELTPQTIRFGDVELEAPYVLI